MNFGILLIVFIILFILSAYLSVYTKEVNDILNRIDQGNRGGFLDGIDIISVIKVYRNGDKLSELERKLFKNVLVLSTVTMTFFVAFVLLIFIIYI